MIKVAIIGFGKIGQLRASELKKISDVEIASIFDPYINKQFIDSCSMHDLESVISDPSINACFISTTNNLNKDLIIKSLKNDKHVFCEKPPAFSYSDVLEIAKVYETKNDLILGFGFNHRHHGAIQKLKELVDSNEYGKILWMRGRYGKSVDSDFFKTWRANKDLSGGGILLDQGIHMLDLFNYIGGSFDDIRAFVSNLYWNLPGIEDNVFAIMRNSNTGLTASLHSTMTQWRHLFSLEVFLEKGYMVLNGLKTSSDSYGEEILTVARNRSKAPAASWESEEKYSYLIDSSWEFETKEFVRCIKNKIKYQFGDIEDAKNVMRLITEIYSNESYISEDLKSNLIG